MITDPTPQEWAQWIPIRPKVKARPRLGKGGRVYTPKTTGDFEKLVAAAYDGPTFEGPVEVDVRLCSEGFWLTIRESTIERPKYLKRGDIDNFFKAVGDGLNQVAFEDDKQIHGMSARFSDGVGGLFGLAA